MTQLTTSTPQLSDEERRLAKNERERARYNNSEAKRKRAERWAAYSANNRARLNARQRARHAADPDKQRNANLKCVYGITLDQWNTMFDAQGKTCAICRSTSPKTKRGWQTDHNHSTGQVRGILCMPCNTAIGHLQEDGTTLSNAIDYLKAHNG